jgi:hypothetical protein
MVCINAIALNGTQNWLALIIWFSFDFGWIVQRSLAFYRDVTDMLDLKVSTLHSISIGLNSV